MFLWCSGFGVLSFLCCVGVMLFLGGLFRHSVFCVCPITPPKKKGRSCHIVPDYRTRSIGTRTVAAGLSSASSKNVQKYRMVGIAVENSCQTCLSKYFSNDVPKLRSDSAHSPNADTTTTPPPTDRAPLSNETSDPYRSLVKCHTLPDYRTFIDDYLKILDFIEWLKVAYPEKAAFLTKKS